jgi:hypothetical protein
MVFHPWIEKGRQIYRQTERVPNVTILKCALWLERKYEQEHSFKTAGIISLHYLVLALRKQAGRRALLFDHYMSQALQWRREAIRFNRSYANL